VTTAHGPRDERPHKGLSIPATAIGIARADSRTAHSMPAVWRDFFGVAVWLRDESRHWRDSCEQVAEMRCAFGCLLHCYITVEASVNAYAAWFLPTRNAPVSRNTVSELERLDAATKLLVYPVLFADRPVFDAAGEPYQSFRKLKRMRDNFVVHPKPKMRVDDRVDVTADGHIRMFDAEPRIGSLTGLAEWKREPQCDAGGAEWGCSVVREVCERLSDAGGPVFDLAVFENAG